jgi:hypothetical protein
MLVHGQQQTPTTRSKLVLPEVSSFGSMAVCLAALLPTLGETLSLSNYGSQHWNSHECENWVHKGPRESNGYRHEYDLWCEFDC